MRLIVWLQTVLPCRVLFSHRFLCYWNYVSLEQDDPGQLFFILVFYVSFCKRQGILAMHDMVEGKVVSEVILSTMNIHNFK